jgi:hypothetical protein
LFDVELTRYEAIRFKDLEFITNYLNNFHLSLEGDDSSAMVEGMAHNRSPSLHVILEESPSEDDLASSEGESSDSPIPMACNMVTSATPITSTPQPKETSVHQTIPAVLQRVTNLRPDTRPLPEQLMAHQEER